MNYPSRKLLEDRIEYNQETGEFRWKSRDLSSFSTLRAGRSWNSRCAGNRAESEFVNTRSGKSYYSIAINGVNFRAHRLAMIIMGFEICGLFVDHINGNGLDNRACNLRLTSRSGNMMNTKMPISNTSGVVGVSWHRKRKQWQSYIHVNRKRVGLGWFNDFDEAVKSRKAAEIKYGYHKNHGSKRHLY